MMAKKLPDHCTTPLDYAMHFPSTQLSGVYVFLPPYYGYDARDGTPFYLGPICQIPINSQLRSEVLSRA
jgi:hypothetical protein